MIHQIYDTDIELMRSRMQLTLGRRVQAMLDARAVLVGMMRGRLRRRYPELSEQELNMKLLEEIERGQQLSARPHPIS